MKYVGKLFGQIGRTRGYFDTGKTSEDWDALETRAERAEAELRAEVERLRGYSDELDGVTNALGDALARAERAEAKLNESRYETVKAAQEGLRECIRAERAEAELAAEWARHTALRRAVLDVLCDPEGKAVFAGTDADRAAIDLAMKDGAK